MDGAGDQFLTSSSFSNNQPTLQNQARRQPVISRESTPCNLDRCRQSLREHECLSRSAPPEHHVFVVELISQTLNLFKRLLQVGSRAVVFGDVY